MTTEQIRSEIEKHESLLKGLVAAQESNRERLNALEAERPQHVVAARAHHDQDSQQELRRIDAEIESAKRDGRDDDEAIEQVQAKLKSLGADLGKAVRREGCDRILEMIRARRASGVDKRVAELARALRDEVNKLRSSNQEIASAMLSLDANLKASAGRVESWMRSDSGALGSFGMGDHYEQQVRELAAVDFTGWADAALANALHAVESSAARE